MQFSHSLSPLTKEYFLKCRKRHISSIVKQQAIGEVLADVVPRLMGAVPGSEEGLHYNSYFIFKPFSICSPGVIAAKLKTIQCS